MRKLKTNLSLIICLIFLISCKASEFKQICIGGKLPFKFQEETKEWLKQCEAVNKPPIQVLDDFDRLSKRNEKSVLDNPLSKSFK